MERSPRDQQDVPEKQGIPSYIKEELARKNACYVLITCGDPTDSGKMDVEMAYEGDPVLAAYLLDSAQTFIDPSEDDLEETRFIE